MLVPWGDVSRIEVDAHLNNFASLDAQIMPLQVRALASRQLRSRDLYG
jgi:hypothetical protein